jgi:asparagine synthase (glutamine-hydrolysing)
VVKKNVLFVIMDGCRARSLGCYGYTRRDTSPFIDGIAAKGAVVDRFYASSNCTIPSVISMMTGVYPAQHRAAGTWSYYDGRYPFLTDLLRANGFQTFYASNTVTAMSPEWGFIRGYDRSYRAGREVNWFRDAAEQRRGVRRDPPSVQIKKDLFRLARRYFPDKAEQTRTAAQLRWYQENDRGTAKAVASVGRMLNARDRDKPFFMFVNLADTHSPYLAAEPHAGVWGRMNITKNLLDLNLVPGEMYDEGRVLDAEERATLVQMYDTCVRYIDHSVSRLASLLDEAKVSRDTIIVLLGDHGGETYEHKELNGAASFTYEPEIRVPCIISGADGPARVGGLRSVVDIFPTILELCGVTPMEPTENLQGRSLFGDSAGHAGVLADVPAWPRWLRDMIAERSYHLRYGRSFRTLVRQDGTKIIWVHDGDHEVYDLNADPGEQTNLYDPKRSLPLLSEVEDRYAGLMGPIGRRLEIYEHTDVGPRLANLPPLAITNPGFDPDSVVTVNIDMCGIAGYVSADASPWRRADAELLGAGAYRGPDARTVWSDERHVTMLHARLSIIDLECGGQPMADTTGRYTIVFNGAIYNYQELRREYEGSGARFRTHSDTEVLLNGFALKGERVLADLNGMFAFAVWDARDKRLFMARDRLGKKPLFWTRVGDALVFASTVAAFRRLPGWKDELSPAGLVLYSFLGGFPADSTAFANAKALPPGHFAWYAIGDAAPRPSRYWLPRYDRKARDPESALLEEYETTLSDAVRIRLRSDVPLALSFSGGTDSGTIAALAGRWSQAPLNCYTIDYHSAEEPSVEVAMARQVALKLGLPWTHIQYDYRAELLEGLHDAYQDFDQPCQQLALVYSRRLHEVMSHHCRVVLSGNGADELFTGYAADAGLHAFDRNRRWLRRIPACMYQRFGEHRRAAWNHVRLDGLTIPEWARHDMLAYAREFTRDPAVIDECRFVIDGMCDAFAAAGIDTMTDFVMHRGLVVSTADTNYRLPDITGYAAHVEVRSPFLDYRMVEFAARLPHRLKIGVVGGERRPKFLPRRFYERLVGPEIAWAPKLGMGANLHWPQEFARNPKFESELASAYRALPGARLVPTAFEHAYQSFRAAVAAKASSFPTSATMMNGFMLGAWLERVYAPGSRDAA